MNLIADIGSFLRRPRIDVPLDWPPTPNSSFILFRLLALMFAVVFLTSGLVSALFSAFGIDRPETTTDFEELLSRANIVVIALLIPFVEEGMFRSWLRYPWAIVFAMPLILILVTFWLIEGAEGESNFAVLMLFAALISLYYFIVYTRRTQDGFLENLAHRLFPVAFFGSTTIFSLSHLYNFAPGNTGVFVIMMVLPQFCVGLLLGYARMRFGFLSAVGLHGSFNGLLIGLATMAS